MIFWTGVCWACTKCGSAFVIKCPFCGANPGDGETEHKKEICNCHICKGIRKAYEKTKKEDKMQCEKHPGQGTVILSDGTEVCYGCYCEQFDYCPRCGKELKEHPPDGFDCKTKVSK